MNILLRLILYRIKKQRNFENAEMVSHRTWNNLNATFLIKITLGFSPPPPQYHRGEIR